MEKQDKIAHWKLLFKEHEESRLSLNEFCTKKQIKRPTYHYWKNRLIELEQLRNEVVNTSPQEFTFVKVPDTISTSHQEITLHLEWNEVKLSITTEKEAVLAAKLIKELRSIC